MSDDLVKRWDEYVESMGCVMGEAESIAQQMRDRIEELEAKLKSETERLGREVNLARYGQPDFAWSIHVQAMAELEAKLADRDAMVEAAYRMALEDAAKEAGRYLSTPEDANLASDIIERICTLTPPADLVERVKGETK